MKQIKPWLVIFAIAVISLTTLFPPFYFEGRGNILGVGFGFLFTGPFDDKYQDVARVDYAVLITFWLAILLICFLLHLLPKGYQSKLSTQISSQFNKARTHREKILPLVVVGLIIAMFAIFDFFANNRADLDTSGLKYLSDN
ncbi:hypothetical protein [Thalassospira australica]|uniref:hypothetical protein n=1 Tax=Thalassospira australica TaxID=1528106 RepID=UPI00051A4922|nr:hypothetical protein [Thalassospira australica]